MSQHITVLLAAYNGAPYIEEQIRSILDQTLPPDQLLISDDGSTEERWSFWNGYRQNIRL